MTFIRNRRFVAVTVAAACLAVPASASADSLPSTYKSDAAQSGSAGSLPSSDRSDAAQSVKDPRQADMHASTVKKPTFPPAGFNGGDRAQSEGSAKSTFPSADFRGGDTPIDHPGAGRAPSAAPTTIEVVRPERTIVRDVDEALPLILSSTALLLVLASLAITLVRTRMVPRPGRIH
jgi:hypothetical protein